MTVSDFNSKVNLPRFVEGMGYDASRFTFVKLPTFGWYAYNQDKSFIGNVFDFVTGEEKFNLYEKITKKNPHYLDFKLPYSEYTYKRLKGNLVQWTLWQNVWLRAKEEVKHRVKTEGRILPFKELLYEQGMGALLDNEMGYLSENIINENKKLDFKDRYRYRKTVVIPSFVTPKHIASIEIANLYDLKNRTTLYQVEEKGWYGSVNSRVVSGIENLVTKVGCTWDSKCDYWNDGIVTLDDSLSTSDLVQIWNDSNYTAFDKHPIQAVIESGRVDELRNFVSSLSRDKITEIESMTGQPLASYWRKAREEQVNINGYTYFKKADGYYMVKKGKSTKLTNFTIEAQRIAKKEGKHYWQGQIFFGDSVTPFELEAENFDSPFRFQTAIKKLFRELGIGVAYVDASKKKEILEVITLTHPELPIEATTE